MQQETTDENTGRGARSSAEPIQFQDAKGQMWRVSERIRLDYDRRSVSMLVFESSVAIRCVRVYPENWRALDPEALEYLSWKV